MDHHRQVVVVAVWRRNLFLGGYFGRGIADGRPRLRVGEFGNADTRDPAAKGIGDFRLRLVNRVDRAAFEPIREAAAPI